MNYYVGVESPRNECIACIAEPFNLKFLVHEMKIGPNKVVIFMSSDSW